MNEQALTALKKSIEHWERLVAGDPDEMLGSGSCALCREFAYIPGRSPCVGCPVREKTGLHGCVKSPYHDAVRAKKDYTYCSPEFKLAARAELDFLKSLLPAEGRTTAAASSTAEVKLDADAILEIKKLLPRAPYFSQIVCRPEFKASLEIEFNRLTDRLVIGSTLFLCGIEIHAKADQQAPAWAFADRGLCRGYLEGRLVEHDLSYLLNRSVETVKRIDTNEKEVGLAEKFIS